MGTAELNNVGVVEKPSLTSFYSLSRDGDSGTGPSATSSPSASSFLFAVARWGQRNNNADQGHTLTTSFYSLSRDGDSGTAGDGDT